MGSVEIKELEKLEMITAEIVLTRTPPFSVGS